MISLTIFHLCFQDDSYLESYISTIGVDFVSDQSIDALCTVYQLQHRNSCNYFTCSLMQKIRTVEQEGKTIKLQIVSFCNAHYGFVMNIRS